MKDIDVFDQKKYGLDFTDARTIGLNNMYVKRIESKDLLKGSEGIKEWDVINFSKKNGSVRKATIEWKMNSPVTIFGIALWWNAELAEGISLSTSPFSSFTHWDQIFLPLLSPIKLAAGHTLSLSLVSDTRPRVKINLTWEAVHLDAHGKKLSVQKLDMRKGYIN
jgi:protein arginine N-methyltransferase 1